MNIHDMSLTLAEALLRSHSPAEEEMPPGQRRHPEKTAIHHHDQPGRAGAKGTSVCRRPGQAPRLAGLRFRN